MKRFLSTLLILILIVSLLTACGKKTNPAAVSAPFEAGNPAATDISGTEETTESVENTPTSSEPETPVEADEDEESTEEDDVDSGGLYVTDVYIVELEEGQALGGG